MRSAEKAQGHAIHHSDAITFQGIECVSGLGNCAIVKRPNHAGLSVDLRRSKIRFPAKCKLLHEKTGGDDSRPETSTIRKRAEIRRISNILRGLSAVLHAAATEMVAYSRGQSISMSRRRRRG